MDHSHRYGLGLLYFFLLSRFSTTFTPSWVIRPALLLKNNNLPKGSVFKFFEMKKITLSVLLTVFYTIMVFGQTWTGESSNIGEPQNIVLTKTGEKTFTLKWSFYDKSKVETKYLTQSSIQKNLSDACGRANYNGDAKKYTENSSNNYFIITPTDDWIYLSYVNELGQCIYKSFFTLFLPYDEWKSNKPANTTNSEPNKKVQRVFDAISQPEQQKPQISTQDGDAYDKTVYSNCTGEYKLGCTDVNGHIKEVQICLGVPATGKFGPLTEKALINKHGIFKFTPDQIWILCGKSGSSPAVYK
jgi:hypothetical protein